ncbi:unnamed protein product [Chondrus crispus]|uniref:Uncharacterized protein n=1 Tax=Chondrus crispus TaxID=2769 RepID=R7QHU1_CHOCR|nr:unnamed protein product [Chondrus crispus]CDF38082.1 unnamed protein product [Chondrus crispus]|eukprot:XP_005717951.1 unnamed protein product [Chondrus crispus]
MRSGSVTCTPARHFFRTPLLSPPLHNFHLHPTPPHFQNVRNLGKIQRGPRGQAAANEDHDVPDRLRAGRSGRARAGNLQRQGVGRQAHGQDGRVRRRPARPHRPLLVRLP